jgi:phenylacetate-CoA ligase
MRFKHLDVEQIRQLQFPRFVTLLNSAYRNVPMYQELYDTHDFKPASVKRYEDIDTVPVLTKQFIRSHAVQDRIDKTRSGSNVLIETTSGSTGEPSEIWTDPTENFIQSLKAVRFLKEWGYSFSDNTVQLWRDDAEPKKSLVQKLGLLRRQFVSIIDPPDIMCEKIAANRCDVLYATRSSLEILADELAKRQMYIRPGIVVAGCEVFTDQHRAKLHEAFGTQPLEIYGCMETGSIAWGCPDNPTQLHIDMETVVVNYFNVRRDPDGQQTGSIAVTNLENRVMPFIRFDPGDELSLPVTEKCGCGRTLPLLGKVNGRYDDVIDNGKRQCNFHFFYNYFKNFLYINKYKVLQRKSGEIVFLVQLANDSEQERQRCLTDLQGVFGQHFVPLNVSFVSEFPVSRSGKFKVIEVEH